MEEETSKFLTIGEAQAILGVGRSKLYQLLDAGEIVSVKIGKSRRVPLHEVQRFQREVFNTALRDLAESAPNSRAAALGNGG